jgi:hypothetical protein
MSRAEWSVMLGGFWVSIKKEAHHFWVRASLLRAGAARARVATAHLSSQPCSHVCPHPRARTMQVGSKLLYAEMRISARLLICVLKGSPLSRCALCRGERVVHLPLPSHVTQNMSPANAAAAGASASS